MSGDWLRAEQSELAVGKILDAATTAFLAKGVAGTTMAEVARAAGCSRGTLYRYFPNRETLRQAYVNRAALDIARTANAAVTGIAEPETRLRAAIETVLAAVRADEGLMRWFTPTDLGIAILASGRSEVIDAIVTAFFAGSGSGSGEPASPSLVEQHRRAGRWLVRLIVSLLGHPEADPAAERAVLDEFVVPSLLGAFAARTPPP